MSHPKDVKIYLGYKGCFAKQRTYICRLNLRQSQYQQMLDEDYLHNYRDEKPHIFPISRFFKVLYWRDKFKTLLNKKTYAIKTAKVVLLTWYQLHLWYLDNFKQVKKLQTCTLLKKCIKKLAMHDLNDFDFQKIIFI